MFERLRIMAVPVLAAVVALFMGLEPSLLGTGRVQPLDWLAPCFAGLAVMVLAASRGGKPLGWGGLFLYLAIALLPVLLLCAMISTVRPWPWLLALTGFLIIATAILGAMLARPKGKWVMAGAGLLLLIAMNRAVHATEGRYILGRTPDVGVMSALPLFGAGQGPKDGLLSVGGMSPLMDALFFIPEPMDVLDAKSLAPFAHLLLAQPRLLHPEELVALDSWVRAGGHVVILADPLLHWPTGHALGDPRRPPLTSLLDPLLTHWGLTLEPANGSQPEERRVLSGGEVLQLSGSSRFTLAKGAPCILEEQALFARCTLGKGSAMLVADADWINDAMWTVDPQKRRDRGAWTSDAVGVLSALVKGDALYGPQWPWLTSQDALIAALRWSIALILLLGVLLAAKGPIPISTHDPPRRKPDQDEERDSVSPDSVA